MKKNYILLNVFILGLLFSCGDAEPPVSQLSLDENRVAPQTEYTKYAPGEWSGMEADHLPIITKQKGRNIILNVYVPLKNPDTDHYIEKTGIMDAQKNDIVVKSFASKENVFEAKFQISSAFYSKGVKVFAKCNLHDLWTVELRMDELQ